MVKPVIKFTEEQRKKYMRSFYNYIESGEAERDRKKKEEEVNKLNYEFWKNLESLDQDELSDIL